MKVRIGGGGIDKDGNAYELPEVERDIPGDDFKKMLEALWATPKSKRVASDDTELTEKPVD